MVLRFTGEMFRTMEQRAAAAWDRETGAELLELYPDHMRALGASLDEAEAFCRLVRDYATAYHVSEKREVFRLVVVSVALGAHFAHDPRFEGGIAHSLARLAVPQDRRLVLLGDFVEAWLGATWGGEGFDVVGARLVEVIRRGGNRAGASREGVRAALDGLVSQSPTIATPARRAAFLDAVLAQADGYGLSDPPRRLAYAGGALLHGVYWFDDPLMGWGRAAVEGAASADDLCDRLGAFYEGFA